MLILLQHPTETIFWDVDRRIRLSYRLIIYWYSTKEKDVPSDPILHMRSLISIFVARL